jgi:hypothetical protein
MKNNSASILFLDFFNLSTKQKLMKHARSLQKDQNKKYLPILTDQIFKLEPNDTSRGMELNFRDAITDFNRKIYNQARKNKNVFSNVWFSRGYVMVRVKNGDPIKITSLNHLNSLVKKT